MKLYIVILLSAVSVCLLAVAATRQWSIDGGFAVQQLVADGYGGCALYWYRTNVGGEIVWVDKKGVIKYRKELHGVIQFPIIRCGKKELVYIVSTNAHMSYAVHVHGKGVEQEIRKARTLVETPYIFGSGSYQKPSDKKGFFTGEYTTNPPIFHVVRYTYK
jgi:hypothetical protein